MLLKLAYLFWLVQPDDKALGAFLWIWDCVVVYRRSKHSHLPFYSFNKLISIITVFNLKSTVDKSHQQHLTALGVPFHISISIAFGETIFWPRHQHPSLIISRWFSTWIASMSVIAIRTVCVMPLEHPGPYTPISHWSIDFYLWGTIARHHMLCLHSDFRVAHSKDRSPRPQKLAMPNLQ